jgi:hypothetical protein
MNMVRLVTMQESSGGVYAPTLDRDSGTLYIQYEQSPANDPRIRTVLNDSSTAFWSFTTLPNG